MSFLTQEHRDIIYVVLLLVVLALSYHIFIVDDRWKFRFGCDHDKEGFDYQEMESGIEARIKADLEARIKADLGLRTNADIKHKHEFEHGRNEWHPTMPY